MTSVQIIAMQERIGAKPDGFWGPRSIEACRDHLRRLMPSPNPWPKPTAAALRKFYGEPGDEGNLVTITFPYPMFYGVKEVTRTRCHKRIAEPLLRVLGSIRDQYAGEERIMIPARDYGGIFNFRQKRGGTSWSLHAYGAAIDLDADTNAFRDSWPMKASMPLEIMERFAYEGFKSAGAFWGYDAMHFEATS